MNTLDTLFSRRSVRSYTGEMPTQEELDTVLKAADAAPVARGIYEDVHLTVIRDRDLLTQIDAAGAAFFGNPGIHPLYHAPVLILVSSRKTVVEKWNIAFSNAAILVHNMCLAATELGLGQCCIWGATAAMSANETLMKKLGLPEDFMPCCALILGKTEESYTLRQIPVGRIDRNFID